MKTYVTFYTSVSIHPVSHPIWPNKAFAALNTINRVIREHLAAEIKLPPNLIWGVIIANIPPSIAGP